MRWGVFVVVAGSIEACGSQDATNPTPKPVYTEHCCTSSDNKGVPQCTCKTVTTPFEVCSVLWYQPDGGPPSVSCNVDCQPTQTGQATHTDGTYSDSCGDCGSTGGACCTVGKPCISSTAKCSPYYGMCMEP